MEIRFSILKTDIPAGVQIYSLDGNLVRELEGGRGTDGFWIYTWSGKDGSGTPVTPGIYLCCIELDAQVGTQTLARTIGVAY